MKVGASLKKGKQNIEMILLSILMDGDYYGYQLTQLINGYSKNLIEIPESSLYPALYRLLEKGYVSDKKVKIKVRQQRIYYHIESAGYEYYQTLLDEYNRLNNGILNILNRTEIVEADNLGELKGDS